MEVYSLVCSLKLLSFLLVLVLTGRNHQLLYSFFYFSLGSCVSMWWMHMHTEVDTNQCHHWWCLTLYVGSQASTAVPLLTKPSPQPHYMLLRNSLDTVLSVYPRYLPTYLPACLPACLPICFSATGTAMLPNIKQLTLADLETYQIHSQTQRDGLWLAR